jgi:acyl CoA:acetate/3-ketoacid CoA transferase beta subunit
MAVFDVAGDHLVLLETAPGVSVHDVLNATAAAVTVAADVREMTV